MPSTLNRYSYVANNPLRYTDPSGECVVDAAGNLIARGSDAYSYDAANRLVSASQNGVTQTATYDGDGTRTATTVGSTTTDYVHDVAAGLPLVIDDGTRRYVWGPAGLAYSVDTASGAIEVVHADHLGSVRTSTDASGTVTATARYNEFGVPLDATGSPDSPFGFTGEPTDPTGLVHLRARSYDPSLGRFLNRDPWVGVAQQPDSLNRYSYVTNNPMRHADPSGMCGVDLLADGFFIAVSFFTWAIGPEKDRQANAEALGLDIAGAAIPCAAGLGTIRRAIGAADTAIGVGRGFSSFDAFKRSMGPAAPGMEWHHVVGQHATNAAQFGPQAIHNTANLVQIPQDVHRRISGYYSSVQEFTGGARVRDWLKTQSFEDQYEFGVQLMRQYGLSP